MNKLNFSSFPASSLATYSSCHESPQQRSMAKDRAGREGHRKRKIWIVRSGNHIVAEPRYY
jgi:hypothetical protein